MIYEARKGIDAKDRVINPIFTHLKFKSVFTDLEKYQPKALKG